MFARVLALLPLALLVSASHLEARGQCDTGSINCCNSYQTVDQAMDLLKQLNLVNAAVQAGAGVGLTCDPITVIGGVTGNGCSAQTVCCSGNNFNGLVNIGCTPINI